MKALIKIAVVSKSQLMRQGIITLLQKRKRMQVIFNASDKAQLINHLKYKLPHIMVVNIERSTSEIEELLIAAKPFGQIRAIALLVDASDALILQLLEQGVKAILTKNATIQDLEKAIKEVHDKGYYSTRELTQVIDRQAVFSTHPANYSLTPRETEILFMVSQGKTSREIAKLLFVSIKTVENHRYNLLKKTGGKNQFELEQWADNVEP